MARCFSYTEVRGKIMSHFKHTYLIIILSILTYSCINVREENIDIPLVKLKAYNCLIDSIGKYDTLYIKYSTQGCFHYSAEELKIYRKADRLFAELKVSRPNTQELPSLTQHLKDSSIIAYSEFEKSGKTLITKAFCTTTEQFIICIKADSIKFEDNACEFDGYEILKNKIFGQAKIDNYYEKIFR